MSKYQDFGLDEKKISRGPAEIKDKFRCLWCDSDVQHGFNLCFSNFVICRDCVETSHFEEEAKRWKESCDCFKCGSTNINGFRVSENITIDYTICDGCIDWAKESFNRKDELNNKNREQMTTDEILQQCTVIGNSIKLPDVLLDYETEYKPLKKKLEGIGGKWKGGKIEAFVFDGDPTELLVSLQAGTNINLKKDFQFFPTPEDLGMHLIGLSPISLTKPRIKVLEPSAGDGALIKCIHQIAPDLKVDCFELMGLNLTKLTSLPNVNIIGADFIKGVELDELNLIKNQYDLIIANPPFTGNQDIDHIKAMYECLKVDGALVTIASKSWTFGEQKKQVEFREWLSEIGAYTEEIQPGKFKASGTMVGSMIISLTKKNIIMVEDKTKWSQDQVDTMNETIRKPMVIGLKNKEPEILESPEEILDKIKENMESVSNTFKELKQLINPKTESEMSFFNQLSELLGQAEVTLCVKAKNDKLTVMVTSKGSSIQPVLVTGTAEELDEGFFEVVSAPVRKLTGLSTNVKESSDTNEIDENSASKGTTKKPSRSKKAEVATVDNTAPETNTEENAAPEEVNEEALALQKKQDEEDQARKEEEEKAAAEEEERKRAEQERAEQYESLISTANGHEAENKFKEAAIKVKAAKEFSNDPEADDVRVKALMQKHLEQEMNEI